MASVSHGTNCPRGRPRGHCHRVERRLITAESEDITSTDDETRDAPVDRTAPARADHPDVGGRYVLHELLGAGGMGRVFAAQDQELGRTVALKLLSTEATHARDRVRLLREALALARLSHPNVVQIYDAGMHGEEVFISMELVAGTTLRKRLERPLPWTEVLDLFVAAGRGLEAAHKAGLVHRDFKPSNVLVGDDARVRVADFGLAADLGGAESSSPAAGHDVLNAELTQHGAVVGTPRYMAPEQHCGGLTTAATDQFAWCVGLYEALYRIHPFGCGVHSDWHERVREGRILPPENSVGPGSIRRALVRGLSVDPQARHPDVASLLRAVEGARRRWSRTRIGLGIALPAALVAVPLALWAQKEPCQGSSQLLAETWSSARADRVSEALENADTTLSAPVLDALNTYAASWELEHRQACLAARAGALTRNAHDAVDACLRRRLSSLDATVQVIERTGAELGDPLVDATSRLPLIERCRTEALARILLDPPRPGIENDVSETRDALARVEAIHAAGEFEAALERLDVLNARADALGYAPLQAEAGLVTARLAMDRMDWLQADLALDQAKTISLSVGADLEAAESAARRVFVRTMLDGPGAIAPHELAVTRALAKRAGEPAWLKALVENNVGVHHAIAGEAEAADEAFAKAIALSEGAADVLPVDRVGYLLNVALRTEDPEARDRQFEEAAVLSRRTLGSTHGRTLEIALLRAQATADDALARDRMRPICEHLASRLPSDWSRCHLCFWQLAEVGGQGAQRASECLEGAPADARPSPEWRTRRAMNDALLLVGSDTPADALASITDARAVLDSHPPTPWLDYERASLTLLEVAARGGVIDDTLASRLQDAKRALQERLATSHDQTPARRLRSVEAALSRRPSPPVE